MSVRFVIGRAGSGKTRHCIESIAAGLEDAPLGPAIFWVVPRSATFQAERELACGAGRRGSFRCRVVSIESFVQMVLDECGGADVAEVTAVGRQMILERLLQREEGALRYFRPGGGGTGEESGEAGRGGLARRLDATFGEIERADRGVEDLQQVLESLGGGKEDPQLGDKLRDLHHLYRAYSDYIGQERLDPRRRMAQVLERIEQCPLLRGAAVYVDAYTRLSDAECRVLAAAARVTARMEITLMMDPACELLSNPHHRSDEFSLFYRTEDVYRRLWFALSELGVEVEEPLRLESAPPALAPAKGKTKGRDAAEGLSPLNVAARGSGSPHSGFAGEDSGGTRDIRGVVAFVEAPDRAAEVDAAARRIQMWVRQGMRLREIVVLARDLEGYHGLIESSFAEHRLAFFMDRRRTAGHHPILGLLGGALWIARENWPQDAVLGLMKSGLGGVTAGEADEIENYVLAHRIRGAGWADEAPWKYIHETRGQEQEASPGQRELAQRVDLLRRKAIDPLRPFVMALRGGALTAGRIVAEMRGLLERYQVAQTVGRWMEQAEERGELEVRAEHQRVWDELQLLLEQMETLLGDQAMTLGDFSSIFQTALEGFDLALTPPTLDQVLVGQVDRSVIPSARGVIVLGLNEGMFPAVPREDSILNDRDRRALQERQLNIEPDTRRLLLDERLLGYIAFTRAWEKLCVMRHRGDAEGKAAAPSVFWLNLRRAFPDAPLEELGSETAFDPRRIGTPRQLVAGLMEWVRGEGSGAKAPGVEVGSSDIRSVISDSKSENFGPRTPDAASFASLYQWLAGGVCDGGAVDWLRERAWAALSYENKAELLEGVARLLFTEPGSGILEATAGQLESFTACPFQHFLRYGLNLKERREDQEVGGRDLSHLYHRILRRLVRHLLQQRSDWEALESQLSERLIAQYAQEVGVALKNEWMLSTGRNQYLLGRIARTLNQVVAHQRAAARRGNFSPAHAEVGFGDDQALPAWSVRTPAGNTLKLRGTIDRIDLLKSGAAAVVDYRLTGQALSLAEVYYGLSLQLLVALMAVRDGSGKLEGRSAAPAAAFYLQMLRQLKNVAHPEMAGDPADAAFELKIKPRGILDAFYLPDLDKELEQGASAVVSAYIKKDGQCGLLDSSDVATSDQLASLLEHVRTLVGQLADRMMKGEIAIRPYRLGQVTPCPRCAYKSICRFDPAMDRYHHLTPMERSQVLEGMQGKSQTGSIST
jgi:ATP-dependent helicase/nuclease subunit B